MTKKDCQVSRETKQSFFGGRVWINPFNPNLAEIDIGAIFGETISAIRITLMICGDKGKPGVEMLLENCLTMGFEGAGKSIEWTVNQFEPDWNVSKYFDFHSHPDLKKLSPFNSTLQCSAWEEVVGEILTEHEMGKHSILDKLKAISDERGVKRT